jgi:uncharacterized protein
MSFPTVVMMLKAPLPSLVKTRLAASIGEKSAVAVYRRLVERQLVDIPSEWPVEVHFAPATEEAAEQMREWLGARVAYYPQSNGDLGARLAWTAERALERGRKRGGSGVLLIGGDCPGLDTETLREAGRMQGLGKVVLGPATDGGYYLLGLQAIAPALFVGIPWSGPEVARVTRERAAGCGLEVCELPLKDDIDTLEDLQRHPFFHSDVLL